MSVDNTATGEDWNPGECVRCRAVLEQNALKCDACATPNVSVWCDILNAIQSNQREAIDEIVRRRHPAFFYSWHAANSVVLLLHFAVAWFMTQDVLHSEIRDWALHYSFWWMAAYGVSTMIAVVLLFRIDKAWWRFCRKHGYV